MADCRWCGDELPAPKGGGRRREFCGQECRNRLFGQIRIHEEHRNHYAHELERAHDVLAAAGSGADRAEAMYVVKRLEGQLAAYDAAVAELRGTAVYVG